MNRFISILHKNHNDKMGDELFGNAYICTYSRIQFVFVTEPDKKINEAILCTEM